MKTLLDIYNKYIINDIEETLNPEDLNEKIKDFWGDDYTISGTFVSEGKVSSIIDLTIRSIKRFKELKERDHKFPVKALYIPGRVFIIIDSSNSIFNISHPLVQVTLVELYMDQFGEFPRDPALDILGYGKELLLKLFRSQRYWGFWVGGLWRWDRKRALIKREIEIIDIQCHSRFIEALGKDTKRKKEIKLYPESGYHLFLSKDLMKDRLKELEENWLEGYDSKLRLLDFSIKMAEKELKRLREEKRLYSDKFENFKNNIGNIIWKDF